MSIDILALAPLQALRSSSTFRTLPPPREAEMAFTGKVIEFADETGLPVEFRNWFAKIGVVTFEDVALACTTEAEVAATLNVPAKSRWSGICR